MIFDCDIHPNLDPKRIGAQLPQPWRRRYEEGNRGPGNMGYWNPNGVQRSDTILADGSNLPSRPEWIAEHLLAPYGIDYAVLNAAPPAVLSPELDFGSAVASAANDVLISDWVEVESRLRASMVVHPLAAQQAAAEIRRVGGHPGVAQVLLPSASPLPYGHRVFEPVFEAAAEMGLPVAIHPGSEGVGISGRPNAFGYPSSYLEWHTGLMTSYVTQLVSMVTEGVFQKFPTLRFVLLEGGVSWLPGLMWRFDKNWKALRQLVPWLEQPPSELVAEHLLLTTQPLEEPERRQHLHQMLAMLDAERILMFSSDFPHWDGDEPDFAGSALPAEMRSRVLAGTACELYGIVL
jgi:predicted TIM-barrel fold metal-dependent hydrolase